MRIKAPLLGGVGAAGLAWLLFAGPAEEPGGRVLLNPHPPEAPRWGLSWETGASADAAPKGARPEASSGAPARGASDSGTADAGVWATPAEFADSD